MNRHEHPRPAATTHGPQDVVLAVDIGGTSVRAALLDDDLLPLERSSAATPATAGASAIIDAVVRLAEEMLRAHPGAGLSRAGVGAAGVVDPSSGGILYSTGTLGGWAGTPLRSALEDRLSTLAGASVPVRVLNDVDAHAIGECSGGRFDSGASTLVVAIGTGIGAALWRSGALHRGARGASGEIGHIPARGAEHLRCPCGARGHLEAIGCGAGIAREFLARTDSDDPIDGRTVASLARGGDPRAADAVRASALVTGRTLAGVVTTLDPGRLLLTGSLARLPEWRLPMERALRAELIEPLRAIDVLLGAADELAPLRGAAIHARDGVVND